MAGKRKLYIERPREDYSTLDRVTGKVRPIVIDQSDGSWPPFVIVQASGFSRRQPRWTDENALLRRALKNFEATIYAVPQGQRWCSHGHWSHLHNFHIREQGKLWTICKTCRNELARKAYAEQAASEGRGVRTYRRAA